MSEVKKKKAKPSKRDIERFRRAYNIDEAYNCIGDVLLEKKLTAEEISTLHEARHVLRNLCTKTMDVGTFLWFIAESTPGNHSEYLEPRYQPVFLDTVFVVQESVEYEGTFPLSYHSTRELAEKALEKTEKKAKKEYRRGPFNVIEVKVEV